jgi:hypothetical protein
MIYKYLDYFSGEKKVCRCEIVEVGKKTYKIRLKEFGPRGAMPGTILQKVHKKNVVDENDFFPTHLNSNQK